jgi:hypothetical protein
VQTLSKHQCITLTLPCEEPTLHHLLCTLIRPRKVVLSATRILSNFQHNLLMGLSEDILSCDYVWLRNLQSATLYTALAQLISRICHDHHRHQNQERMIFLVNWRRVSSSIESNATSTPNGRIRLNLANINFKDVYSNWLNKKVDNFKTSQVSVGWLFCVPNHSAQG